MTMVKCTICLSADGRDKLLVAKLDSLWKHAGRCRAEKDIYNGKKLKVKHGAIYFLKDNAHARNELKYFSKNPWDGIEHHVL